MLEPGTLPGELGYRRIAWLSQEQAGTAIRKGWVLDNQ
jgi:hypothetical protein